MKHVVFGLACLALLCALLVTTDPLTVPSFVLAVPFLLLFVGLALPLYTWLRRRGVGKTRSLHSTILCVGVVVALLVLQSIGQLTPRDALILILFSAVAYFYISRMATTS